MRSILLSSLAILSTAAYARPTTIGFTKVDSVRPATADELYNLAATKGCSAGYVDIGRPEGAKAVVLTNGHCVESVLEAKQAIVNVPARKSFDIFLASGSKLNVTATRLLYATLMDTDIALYELKETNAELEAKGLVPFEFYRGAAPVGSSVRVTSGYWKETQECTLERRVHKLLEGFGTDTTNPSIATDAFALSKDCNVRGGYSGTPVIDGTTNTVIAIAFTGVEGDSACQEGNPCEENEQGVRSLKKGVSYAARVDQLADCLVDGEFKLTLPSCTLFRK